MRAQLPLCLGLAAALGAAATGCTEDEEVIDQGVVPTAVSVDPQDFLSESADVTCGSTAGAMQSFVAAFIDEGPPVSGLPDSHAPGFPFSLPASPATPCSEVASFRYVVLGHRYSAEIDAYDLPASALRPAAFNCDPTGASGSRHMCTADETGKLVPVTRRWKTECGVATQAVAKLNSDVKIRNCDPLEAADGATPGATAILVDPNTALGSLACVSDEGGDIATLSVLPEDTSLPEVTGIPCGSEPAPYAEGIEPGETYSFRIEARSEEDGPVTWGSSCFVIPKVGIVNTATCDPLTNRGNLTVTFQQPVVCPEGGTIEVVVSDGPEPIGLLATLDCGEPATVLGVLAGEYQLEVTVLDADHQPAAAAYECVDVVVPPGATGATSCTVSEPL